MNEKKVKSLKIYIEKCGYLHMCLSIVHEVPYNMRLDLSVVHMDLSLVNTLYVIFTKGYKLLLHTAGLNS